MALAVLATGFLRAGLPAQLRVGNRWLLLAIIVVFLGVLIIGDPGRIVMFLADRLQKRAAKAAPQAPVHQGQAG